MIITKIAHELGHMLVSAKKILKHRTSSPHIQINAQKKKKPSKVSASTATPAGRRRTKAADAVCTSNMIPIIEDLVYDFCYFKIFEFYVPVSALALGGRTKKHESSYPGAKCQKKSRATNKKHAGQLRKKHGRGKSRIICFPSRYLFDMFGDVSRMF